MIFSMRLAGLVFAGAVLVVTAGSVKDGFPCKKDGDCVDGLHCLGKPESLRCKMKKPVGGQCGDPTWVCADKLECVTEKGERYGTCKATDGFPCKKDDHCVDGLHCLGKPESLRCKAKKPVGMQCGDPTWVCQDKLQCITKKGERYGTCKATDGFPCKKDDHCVDGLHCLGKPESLRCKAKKSAGMQCGDPTWVCQDGLDCKTEKGERYGTCVDPKDDEDEPELEDDDDDTKDEEDPKEKSGKGPCGKCPKGTRCLLGKCRKRVDKVEDKPEKKDDDEEVEEYKEEPKDEDEKEDEDEDYDPKDKKKKKGKKEKPTPCIPGEKTCGNGFVCVGKKGKERCKRSMLEGESCKDITWVCARGLVCIGKGKEAICVKRAPYGSECSKKKPCVCGAKCQNGKCVRNPTKKGSPKKKEKPQKKKPSEQKEKPQKKKPSEQKEKPQKKKKPENKEKPGQKKPCKLGKKAECPDGEICVGNSKKSICKRPMQEGQPCPDPWWRCSPGLVCTGRGKKAICKKPSDKVEKKNKESDGCDSCEKGYVCVNTFKKNRACVPISALGKPCGRGKNSAKGRCPKELSCRNQNGSPTCVKLLKGGDECGVKKFEICPRKFRCVGYGKKKCRSKNY